MKIVIHVWWQYNIVANVTDMPIDVTTFKELLPVVWSADVNTIPRVLIVKSVYRSTMISHGNEPQWRMLMHVNVSFFYLCFPFLCLWFIPFLSCLQEDDSDRPNQEERERKKHFKTNEKSLFLEKLKWTKVMLVLREIDSPRIIDYVRYPRDTYALLRTSKAKHR